MTLSTDAYLSQALNQLATFGDKSISSDAMFVIDGFENHRLLTKQFPQPILSAGEGIEIPGPMGTVLWQPSQAKINQQGSIQFYETVNGDVETLLTNILARGGRFDATVYEGTMEKFTRGWRITSCFINFENPDRNWEDKQQVLLLAGTLFYHYTGDRVAGNVKSLAG